MAAALCNDMCLPLPALAGGAALIREVSWTVRRHAQAKVCTLHAPVSAASGLRIGFRFRLLLRFALALAATEQAAQ